MKVNLKKNLKSLLDFHILDTRQNHQFRNNKKIVIYCLNITVKQSGAVEACWAHNPEVRRSKLRSANHDLFF